MSVWITVSPIFNAGGSSWLGGLENQVPEVVLWEEDGKELGETEAGCEQRAREHLEWWLSLQRVCAQYVTASFFELVTKFRKNFLISSCSCTTYIKLINSGLGIYQTIAWIVIVTPRLCNVCLIKKNLYFGAVPMNWKPNHICTCICRQPCLMPFIFSSFCF